MSDPGMEVLTEPYYEALRRGELVLQYCKACDRAIMYPRHVCPFCYGSELDWVQTGGRGVLHSFAVQRVGPPTGFEDDLPYAVQLLGRLWPDTDGTWDGYVCDAPVEFRGATGDEVERRPVAWFRRAG
jgi:hypothetical protein